MRFPSSLLVTWLAAWVPGAHAAVDLPEDIKSIPVCRAEFRSIMVFTNIFNSYGHIHLLRYDMSPGGSERLRLRLTSPRSKAVLRF
jgi:hypothetical protein